MRDIIADIGGIYVAAEKILDKVGLIFMFQYFFWLGGTTKRLASYKINKNEVKGLRDKLRHATSDDKDIKAEIQEVLNEDLDEEFSYR